MELIFITKDPVQAQTMAEAGVDRIMVDLELIGKEARQGHLNTVISRHTPDDVSTIRSALDGAGASALMVRINPLGTHTPQEIDDVIARGADRIMLPMFRHPDEVARTVELIAGRVPLTLLLETSAAFARLPQILAVAGIDDIHIGLNDLHLDMGLDFMFELFGSGLLDHAAALMRDAGRPFGIGGVACIGTGMLPAEAILAAHISLGSERVILSRAFAETLAQGNRVQVEVDKLRAYIARTDLDLPALRSDLDKIARDIAGRKRSSVS